MIICTKNICVFCSWYHVVNVYPVKDAQNPNTDKQVQKVCSLGLPNRTMAFYGCSSCIP